MRYQQEGRSRAAAAQAIEEMQELLPRGRVQARAGFIQSSRCHPEFVSCRAGRRDGKLPGSCFGREGWREISMRESFSGLN